MNPRGSWRNALIAAALAVLGTGAGCADGGGRGTGIGTAFSTIEGNLAASVALTAADADRSCPKLAEPGVVRVEGTEAVAPIEPDCRFALEGVPAGDRDLVFEVAGLEGRLPLRNVPAGTVVHLRDVRLVPDRATAAGIRVGLPQPEAVPLAVVADPPKGTAPLDVKFSLAAQPAGAFGIEWNFGDGSSPSTEAQPAHRYRAPGDFIVEVRLTAARGVQRGFATVRVEEAPPVVNAALSVRLVAHAVSGPAPLAVTFEAQVEGAEGPVTYLWDFGDGTDLRSADAVQAHVYSQPGTAFLAVVAVRDSLGREAGDSFPVVVRASTAAVDLVGAEAPAEGLPTSR